MKMKSFATGASRKVLVMLMTGALFPFQAMAQSGIPTFTPAAEWMVGSSGLSHVRGLKSMKLPCVLTTEYDNGFVVRFSGGGNKILAMAVDFRQDVFQQGKKYDAMISIGDSYVKQVTVTAFTANTLIFNLRPLKDFYPTLKSGETLEIALGDNAMKFSLGQLPGSLPALENCYSGEKTVPVMTMNEPLKGAAPIKDKTVASAPLSHVEKTPVPTLKSSAPQPLLPSDIAAKPLPQSFEDIVEGSDMDTMDHAPIIVQKTAAKSPIVTASNNLKKPVEASLPMTNEPAKKIPNPAPVIPLMPRVKADIQNPEVASNVEPAPATPVKIPDQIKVSQVTPKPQQAVPTAASSPQISRASAEQQQPQSKVLAQTIPPASEKITPMPLLSTETPLKNSNVAIEPLQQTASNPLNLSPAKPAPVVRKWEAKAGEDMKIVLARWSERAGYDLQWQSDQDGKVAQDIDMGGSFEDAVTQLLAENSAATGIGAHVQSSQGRRDLARAPSKDPVPQPPPTQAIIPAMHEEWVAPAGANIQTVIDQWGAKAGVAVVWQSYMSIPVKAPVSVNGDFNTAIQTLLDQYSNDPGRPLAQLNIDPESGQRTLLINSDKS